MDLTCWISRCRTIFTRYWTKNSDAAPETRLIEVGVAEPGERRNEIKTSRYSLLFFLPKNLSEQFRRVIHVYFIIVTIIAISIDSPVSPLTSIVPLGFMVLATAVKNGYEDWLRHKADDRVNNQIMEIVENGFIKELRNSTISPGTLIRVKEGGEVPADLVLLCSEGDKGNCFVTTANLDGDTNLKTLRVPAPLVGCTPAVLPQALRIEIPKPIADLHTFYGRLVIPGVDSIPLSSDKLMLRGSRVLNTEWALGCAVYTGEETKLALNAKYVSNKFSTCESATNRCLFIFIGIIILEIAVSYIAKRYIDVSQQSRDLYLGLGATFPQSFSGVMQDVFSFLLLYFYIIPMSLFVTIELYKFFGALYIKWDEELRCKETGIQALANTSDLNQELGQVEILFSDKTGTLTKNLMTFKGCSINDDVYEERNKLLYDIKTKELVHTGQPDVKLFFTILALCHTAQTSRANMRKFSAWLKTSEQQIESIENKVKNGTIPNANGDLLKYKEEESNYIDKAGEIQYQSSSPDEKALVEAADKCGVTFLGEEGNNLFIKTGDDIEIYERLESVDFTSERKRMSILVRDKKSKIWLYCKGAESSVFPLCRNTDTINKTISHINAFATKGLRTMAIAYREITEKEYQQLRDSIKKQSINNAEQLKQMTQQLRILERDLILIGSTAVEDYLQDDVAETIGSLRSAGIKMWVLTGDKVETSINVAQSCAYISEKAMQMFIIGAKNEPDINTHLEECKRIADHSQHRALIVDGTSMDLILDNSSQKSTFVELSMKCEAVLCCRLSPIQKAKIVKLIKNSPGKPITAAIGDGANDISMIQEAHVGLGLFGKEGHQAARSADYAFAKFSMLKKMLLVMGHWYYQRFSTLIHYSFYKNLVLGNLMFFYQINCAFSTQSIYASMYLTIYNLFTALPCMVLSVTEQRWPADLLTRFTCCSYDGQTEHINVNEVRKDLFASKNKLVISLPPTSAALYKHALRAAYQAGHILWGNALKPEVSIPCPSSWGWTKEKESWTPEWSAVTAIWSQLSLLDHCGCKSGCETMHSGCRRVSLPCTAQCKSCIGGCTNQKNPILYRSISKNTLMSWSRFCCWMVTAVYHSVVIYVIAALTVGDTIVNADMTAIDLWSFGAVMYHLLILVVNLKLWLQARYQTMALAASVVLSVLVYVACNTLYAAVNMNIQGEIFGTYTHLISSLTFWLLNGLVIVATLTPDYLYRYLSEKKEKRFIHGESVKDRPTKV